MLKVNKRLAHSLRTTDCCLLTVVSQANVPQSEGVREWTERGDSVRRLPGHQQSGLPEIQIRLPEVSHCHILYLVMIKFIITNFSPPAQSGLSVVEQEEEEGSGTMRREERDTSTTTTPRPEPSGTASTPSPSTGSSWPTASPRCAGTRSAWTRCTNTSRWSRWDPTAATTRRRRSWCSLPHSPSPRLSSPPSPPTRTNRSVAAWQDRREADGQFQITKLKIASNPFAKGFRESTRTRETELWRLSPGEMRFLSPGPGLPLVLPPIPSLLGLQLYNYRHLHHHHQFSNQYRYLAEWIFISNIYQSKIQTIIVYKASAVWNSAHSVI